MKNGGISRFIEWVNNGGSEDDETFFEFRKRKINRSLPINKLDKKKLRRLYQCVSIIICSIFVLTMLFVVNDLPVFGNENNPAFNNVSKRYIEAGTEETGATNIVAAMILDYRAFDTFGESNVLFLAVISVLMLLLGEIKEERKFLRLNNQILQRFAAIICPIIGIYGIYIIFNGHISPGGGFSGGAVIGAALILLDTAFGSEMIHRFLNLKIFTLLSATSLLIYCVCKSYSFFTGGNHLHSIIPKGIPGNIFSGGLILPLNICVGLIVSCTLYGFYALFTRGDI